MDDIFNHNMKLGLVVKYECKQNTWITNLFLEYSIQFSFDFVLLSYIISNNIIYKGLHTKTRH